MNDPVDQALLQGVKRKRPRAARACEACRARKYRCDELFPCSRCKRHKVECVYDVADVVRQRLTQSVRSDGRLSETYSQPDITLGTRTASGRRHHPSANASNSSLPRGAPASVEHHGGDGQVDEVSDVNRHTQNPEFHGKTSSLAFLAELQSQAPTENSRSSSTLPATLFQSSLVSRFHNEAFSPDALTWTQPSEVKLLECERYYFRQAHAFLDGYFQNLHFIHPILERRAFMSRCEDLWFGRPQRQPQSFVALYYSVMSLGALVRTWDEEEIEGMGRLEWSRRLFGLARTALEGRKNETSVDFVQCLFFMAKVSQNELNPSLAYMYLGWATRACFSAGFNRRRLSATNEMQSEDKIISNLFWGLYSLETETSFALGRPDGLGPDAYHNQPMPALDDGEMAIITAMVHFSRIIKEVAQSIYLSDTGIENQTERAAKLEVSMHTWLENLPEGIRPPIFETTTRPKIAKDPLWAQRQRLVLELRFYNVKMVLFKPFLASALRTKRPLSAQVDEAIGKCLDAAKTTIELIHDTYCNHLFFRTWWYNTTYVLYAASIVLCYAARMASRDDQENYFALGTKAVEILETMQESIVAKNSAQMMKQIISSAGRRTGIESRQDYNDGFTRHEALPVEDYIPEVGLFPDENLAAFLDLDTDLDLFGLSFPMNGCHRDDFGAPQE